ncbi:MAG: site-specific DNA-methyltransferase [Candidatus Hydrogenedentes bacterium]|nr:site-specific DNA-methyltransferase [Candidatus Hydrogenedentota bacterium]
MSGASKNKPGRVRDAIVDALSGSPDGLKLAEIEKRVGRVLGPTPESSIRSYLRLNTPQMFVREERGLYRLNQGELSFSSAETVTKLPSCSFGKATLYLGDCFTWLQSQENNHFHAVVTDPPYGLVEYSPEQQEKLRAGRGGVWRIPPSFDGHARSPLPRFTTLNSEELRDLHAFFVRWGELLFPKLVPGAHVLVASNPLLSYRVSDALSRAGFERRGELVRLVMTMRGGDRPKAAHAEFSEVSVMPRSMWEPWLIYRKPLEGRAQDNLRKWKTGGFRRPSEDKPFGDVIESSPTRKGERLHGPHPSLKPQSFLRQIVRAVLPLGEGTILDPFAGSGSTLAAAEAVGYASIGIEKDPEYFAVAKLAIPKLAALKVNR